VRGTYKLIPISNLDYPNYLLRERDSQSNFQHIILMTYIIQICLLCKGDNLLANFQHIILVTYIIPICLLCKEDNLHANSQCIILVT
jgi:hypothetical protein